MKQLPYASGKDVNGPLSSSDNRLLVVCGEMTAFRCYETEPAGSGELPNPFFQVHGAGTTRRAREPGLSAARNGLTIGTFHTAEHGQRCGPSTGILGEPVPVDRKGLLPRPHFRGRSDAVAMARPL